MAIQLTNYALDMIATDLSQFAQPNIPELQLRDGNTLQNNALESTMGMFSGEKNGRVRHLMTNIVRRVYASMETYNLGRRHASEYVERTESNLISPYFMALTNFEACISYSWQVADLAYRMTKHKIYEAGDGSAWERLHDLYTVGIKHSFQDSAPDALPPPPTTVWLTNAGISSMNGAKVTFQELAEVIAANDQLFYDVVEKARERRQK